MAGDTQWQIRAVTDPSVAVTDARDLVAANPVAYSVFSTVTASLIQEPGRYADPCWYEVQDAAGRTVLIAMHTPPHLLHLPEHVPGAVAALADRLVAAGQLLPGLNGPKAAVAEFLDRYLPATGTRVRGREGIGVFELPVRARLPWHVDGLRRVADPSHIGLVTSWVQAFMAEVGDRSTDAAATADRQVHGGKVSLWVVDEEPVAMCWASEPFGGVVRVSGVFTPRRHRGHGYASAVVTAASLIEQDRGNTCMLYTQLANPTSNKIYRAVGYRHVGDDIRLTFA